MQEIALAVDDQHRLLSSDFTASLAKRSDFNLSEFL
jgi:hypothetical protein